MKIAIFGLGYVGCVSAACLAKLGHKVVGVDVSPLKAEHIQKGEAPVVEPDLGELMGTAVAQKQLEATTRATDAVVDAEVILICVGTPSNKNGSLDYTFVEAVVKEVGSLLDKAASYPVVVVRSTVLPGIIRERILPLLEASTDKKIGSEFGFCLNPEFLREGSAVADFFAPPFTLIGELDQRSGETLAELYRQIDAPVQRLSIDAASMIKYTSNAYHALKVVFANEIGTFCKKMGVDSHAVMDIFCQDDKLNISPAYLKPGFAFGGSCLPKDLRALLYQSRHTDLELPVLEAILPSNEHHLNRALEFIVSTGKRRIGVVGLSFKPGTDDLRESPLVSLIETLLGKGFDLRIYDEEVSFSQLLGANRRYIEETIPHLASLMCETLDECRAHAEVLVVGKRLPDLGNYLVEHQNENQIILDLVRLWQQEDSSFSREQYTGICW